jgi:hypothetical protein
MSIIYALVSRSPDVVLSDQSDYTGNFVIISRQILKKIQKNKKVIIEYDRFVIELI